MAERESERDDTSFCVWPVLRVMLCNLVYQAKKDRISSSSGDCE